MCSLPTRVYDWLCHCIVSKRPTLGSPVFTAGQSRESVVITRCRSLRNSTELAKVCYKTYCYATTHWATELLIPVAVVTVRLSHRLAAVCSIVQMCLLSLNHFATLAALVLQL